MPWHHNGLKTRERTGGGNEGGQIFGSKIRLGGSGQAKPIQSEPKLGLELSFPYIYGIPEPRFRASGAHQVMWLVVVG